VSEPRTEQFVSYEAPPVIEVVCGVVFEPVQSFTAAMFGQLWNRYKAEFPDSQDRQEIPIPQPRGTFTINLVPRPPLPRVWFVSENEANVIQVQPDRFLFNWRRTDDGDDYPRFTRVYDAFKQHLATFEEFLRENPKEEITPPIRNIQYELTYINHVPVDDVWSDITQIGAVLPDLTWRDDGERFLPSPEHVGLDLVFPLPDGAGTLQVNVVSARRRSTGERILQIKLTAQGQAIGLEQDEWFSLAHKWIVMGFTDITGEKMHRLVWKKEE